jgi:hypothetical protein
VSTTATIHVLDGGRPFEDRVCRILRLRDGRPAAVWRGRAFPLTDGHTIDISAPGVPPAECLPAEAPIGHQGQGPRWGLVEGTEEAWVLIAGSVAERDWVASHLRQAGLAVLRSGAWLGESADGLEPDWFVRIVRPIAGGPLSSLLENILGPRVSVQPGDGETTEDLRRRLVKSELDRVRLEAAALRIEVERLKTGAGDAAALVSRVAALEADLAQAHERLTAQPPAPIPPPVDASPPAQTAPRLTRRIQEEVATALATLLPGVRLLRDSLTVASVEFRDRTAFYRALRELTEGGPRLPPTWKKVRGAEEWWERHVSTGEDDSGRAYARAAPGGAGWDVLLSDKGNQDRDMSWLRKAGR